MKTEKALKREVEKENTKKCMNEHQNRRKENEEK